MSFINLINNSGSLVTTNSTSEPSDVFNVVQIKYPVGNTGQVLLSDSTGLLSLQDPPYGPPTIISNIYLADYASDLDTNTGNLNITLNSNTFNYCVNNVDYYNSFSSDNQFNEVCYALAIKLDGNLYAGGEFTTAGGIAANRIAKWDGSTWSALSSGLNSNCYALAFDEDGNLYAGGAFTTAGGISANRIAKWDGTTWAALGTGLNGPCVSLTCDQNGNLYVLGLFTTAGGVSANRIAKWDGTTWSALGDGITTTLPFIYLKTIKCDQVGNVYVGGYFTNSVGNNLLKWNGTTWSALGTGLNNQCYALAIDENGNLYAGGTFTTAGGVSANRIAKWDGTTWSSLGSGLNNDCYTITVDQSNNIYAAGYFTVAGGVSANVAKWDGSNWFSLPNTMNNQEFKSIVINTSGTLYAAVYEIAAFIMSFDKNVNLSVNNKFMRFMNQNQIINVNVTNNGTPYTNGLAI